MKDQKHSTSPVAILALVVIVGILIGLCPCSFSCSSERARRVACMNNLIMIGKARMMYAMDHTNGVPDLLAITNYAANPRLFICPSSGHNPGPLPSLRQWSDYVMASGLGTVTPPHAAVAFCPPENHDGKGGNILFDDGSVQWFDAKEFWKEVKPQPESGHVRK